MKYHILQNDSAEDLAQFFGGKLPKENSGCTEMEIVAHLGLISGKLIYLVLVILLKE